VGPGASRDRDGLGIDEALTVGLCETGILLMLAMVFTKLWLIAARNSAAFDILILFQHDTGNNYQYSQHLYKNLISFVQGSSFFSFHTGTAADYGTKC